MREKVSDLDKKLVQRYKTERKINGPLGKVYSPTFGKGEQPDRALDDSQAS